MISVNQGKRKHFTFLIYRNRIISIGRNHVYKTHPQGIDKYGYGKIIHSELDCLKSIRKINPKKHTIVNIRLNGKRQIRKSDPCTDCAKMLKSIGFTEILCSDNYGNLSKVFL